MDIESVINYLWDEDIPKAHGCGQSLGRTDRFEPFNGAYVSIDGDHAWGGPDRWIWESVDMRAIDHEPSACCQICADGTPMWLSSKVCRKIPPYHVYTRLPTVETRITSLIPSDMLNKRMRNKFVTQKHYLTVGDGMVDILPLRGVRLINREVILPGSIEPTTLNSHTKSLIRMALAPMAMQFQYRYHASMKVSVGEFGSIRIPMSLGQLREVLADRDKPSDGSRRKALLHIVKGHQRQISDGEAVSIREHLRGKIECPWRGHRITLEPSRYDAMRLRLNSQANAV
jgi:hypothetical protein